MMWRLTLRGHRESCHRYILSLKQEGLRRRHANCGARDVRSLAEAEPERQVFAKFKPLLRKPARRSAGQILRAFAPTEWAAISEIQAKPIPKASCLVFVRLAHDRRFVGAVLLFVLVLFVFIRISGRHRVAHDREGTPVDPGESSSGMCVVMLLLLECDAGGFYPFLSELGQRTNPLSREGAGRAVGRIASTAVII
jgi:hypothetical protein